VIVLVNNFFMAQHVILGDKLLLAMWAGVLGHCRVPLPVPHQLRLIRKPAAAQITGEWLLLTEKGEGWLTLNYVAALYKKNEYRYIISSDFYGLNKLLTVTPFHTRPTRFTF
jgi:hypothetical protein